MDKCGHGKTMNEYCEACAKLSALDEKRTKELARYQAIATAAREVIDGQPLGDTAPDDFIANFRIRLGAIRQLAAALAALEQETK